MSWLRRRERETVPAVATPAVAGPSHAAADEQSGRVERATRGIATLFSGIGADRTHSVLDLGPATNSSLQVYSRYARWVRFADLLSVAESAEELAAALAAIPHHPERPYDLLFAWNLLDRVDPEQRPMMIERLAELSAPDARLYLVAESVTETARAPLRFGIEDVDRMWYEPSGEPTVSLPPLLPAEVERLVAPFHVSRAFTTRVGLREYVAARRG